VVWPRFIAGRVALGEMRFTDHEHRRTHDTEQTYSDKHQFDLHCSRDYVSIMPACEAWTMTVAG